MRKTLPPFYYLDHFHEFLAYFGGNNTHLLTQDAAQFINRFQSMNKDLQAVLVRVANRKHPVVARHTLKHDEISCPDECVDQLIAHGLLASLEQAPLRDIAMALPKAELIGVIARANIAKPPASMKKAPLMEYFCVNMPQKAQEVWQDQPYIYRKFDTTLRFLLFVYFGHMRGQLNQFSMRDLGVMRTRADAVTGEARFDDASDAQAAFTYAQYNEQLEANLVKTPIDVATLAPVSSLEGQRHRASFLYRAGKAFLDTHRTWALNTLSLSDHDEAKERWLRECYKDGQKDTVKNALLSIIDSPSSESLLVFAEDFYARKYKQKRTSALTDMLRNATRCLAIDSQYNQQVELGVVSWYKRKGIEAWRTENHLWRSLFGLTFWRIIYEQKNAALSNEFDRRPAALKHNNLYATHQSAIDALLSGFTSTQALHLHAVKTAAAHYGKANSLFMWRANMLDLIQDFLSRVPLAPVIKHLQAMAQDFAALSDGYPDIMVYENDALRFEEIKAPGDKLRRNQLIALQKLMTNGFDVQVTQVEWIRDPNQPYVVVDIETTGGGSQYHRITEIGMVKMVAGEIVDTWQSLVNPQRHIPSAITRLTGINNAMVENAPCFDAIADAVDAFSQDAIFVAHNVNFDLGFIKQEFARLERYYRRPKLCTVQLMRRTFPNLERYSLAALTHHFDIKMSRHHRAMSDAYAAAELLKIALEQEAS